MLRVYRFVVRSVEKAGARIRGWRVTPLVRFLLLGSALWLGKSYADWKDSFQIEAPTQQQLEINYKDWAQQTGFWPDQQKQAEILQTELNDRVLFKEAIRRKLYLDDAVVNQRLLRNAEFLGIDGDDAEKIKTSLTLQLHLKDELIRRHLIEKMKAVIRSKIAPPTLPDNELLHSRYLAARDRWRVAPMIALEHVFFSSDGSDMVARLESAKRTLSAKSLADSAAYVLGDQFLLGNSFSLMEMPRLRNIFGQDFVSTLQAALDSGALKVNAGGWFGPIKSAYGEHFVKVPEYRKASYRDFDEVKEVLAGEYVREREAAELKRSIAQLVARYAVK